MMTGAWQPETAGNAGVFDARDRAVIWRVAGRGTKEFFGSVKGVGSPETAAGLKRVLRKLFPNKNLRAIGAKGEGVERRPGKSGGMPWDCPRERSGWGKLAKPRAEMSDE